MKYYEVVLSLTFTKKPTAVKWLERLRKLTAQYKAQAILKLHEWEGV